MSQVLYRKWRPMRFDQVVGQEHITQTLCNALALGRVGHAYLFSGPRGTGKTTTARLLAKAVNCLAPELAARPCNACHMCRAVNEGRFLDLIEIDAASNTGVDDVRELREKIHFSPNEGRYKVYIIDEVHMLSTAAFNALLKTLEEPPPHAIFVLATTESHKIPPTVLSRCQRFEFRRIPLPLIVKRLETLLDYEGVRAEPAALDLIARQATGALRDAESLLDQLLSGQPGLLTLAQAQAVLGTASSEVVAQMVAAWLVCDPAAGLDAIQRAVDSGTDPQQFARQMVDYLRALLFFKTSGMIPLEVPEGLHQTLQEQAAAFQIEALVSGVRRFSAVVSESKGGWQPQLPLELAFIESVTHRQGELSAPGPTDAAPAGTLQKAGPSPAVVAERAAHPVARSPVEAPAPAGSFSLVQVQGRREELRAALKRQKQFSVEALLNSGEILGVEGQAVILGYEHGFHREKMEADSSRAVLEAALSEVMGVPVQVRCVDSQDYQPPSPAPPDPEEIKRFAQEELNAEVIETKS